MAFSLLAQLPIIRSAEAESKSLAAQPKSVPASEYEPFKKIAKEKGVKIFINQPPPMKALTALHLDMNMVKASLENAIERTKEKTAINQKLRQLLTTGTPVQQVEFVLGSGTYYFPEDVEQAIAQSENVSAQGAQCWVCENACSVVCSCLGNGDQYCRDKCRQVCHKYC
jgi:hypothetical protein